jgi:hypothetical protein
MVFAVFTTSVYTAIEDNFLSEEQASLDLTDFISLRIDSNQLLVFLHSLYTCNNHSYYINLPAFNTFNKCGLVEKDNNTFLFFPPLWAVTQIKTLSYLFNDLTAFHLDDLGIYYKPVE